MVELSQAILHSFIAVSCLTALTLLNVILFPLFRLSQEKMHSVLNFLVSVSVGALLGDVAFHILPVVYKYASEGGSLKNSAGIQAVLMLGMWTFFIFEKVLQQYHHGHGHGDGHNHGHASDHLSSSGSEDVENQSDRENRIVGQLLGNSDESLIVNSPVSQVRQSTFGYLLLVSDVLHNLVDGLAIGISFSSSFDIGLGTTIAVLFHEIPHELGDYVILISSGMPKMRAFLYSLAANVSGFIGALIGTAINEAKGIQPWVLSFTAGNFLYLALSDLIPELLHDHSKQRRTYLSWVLQNLGLVIGASMMFLIKLLE